MVSRAPPPAPAAPVHPRSYGSAGGDLDAARRHHEGAGDLGSVICVDTAAVVSARPHDHDVAADAQRHVPRRDPVGISIVFRRSGVWSVGHQTRASTGITPSSCRGRHPLAASLQLGARAPNGQTGRKNPKGYSLDPKPFTWTDPDKIIAAVRRGYQTLSPPPGYRRPLAIRYSASALIGPPVSAMSRRTSSRTARRISSGSAASAWPVEAPPRSKGP